MSLNKVIKDKETKGFNKFAMVSNRVMRNVLPVSRSASIKAVNAPVQPPKLFSDLKRRNKPKSAAFAGQQIERKNKGRAKIPNKAQMKTMLATIRKALTCCLTLC